MDLNIILEALKNKGFLIDINDLEDNRKIWQALIDETEKLLNKDCDCNWINKGEPIHLNTYLVCKHCNKKI